MSNPLIQMVACSCYVGVVVLGSSAWALDIPGKNVKKGEILYQKYCVECHGEKGKGDGLRAPLLAPRPGNLVSAATSTKTDRELLQTISNGVPRTAMRGWKDQLSEEDRLHVLAFIRSLVRFQTPSLTPPPPDSPTN